MGLNMQQRIVVVGCGFAGMWSALAARRLISLSLEKGVKEAAGIEVVVIAPEARLVLKPRLYEADPASMSAPLDELFRATGVRFIKGTVVSICTEKHEVEMVDPANARSALSYDRLILAAGSRLVRPNVPGLEEHAFAVDQIEEAIKLETHLRSLASLPSSPARDTIIICGGGFTGIEVASELPGRLRSILGRDVDIRVVVVDREKEIGPDLGPDPRPAIAQALKDLGVETRLGAAVAAVDASSIVLATGERIDALTAVWTAGVAATALTRQIPGEKDKLGRLRVDENLRVPGVKGVFATGDAALAAADDEGNYAKMSCQHAIPLGRSAGHNAAAELLDVPAMRYSQPCYRTCLDVGESGTVVTEGWDSKVLCAGTRAKPVKRFINEVLIYPPKADPAEAFAAADPAANDPGDEVGMPTLRGFLNDISASLVVA